MPLPLSVTDESVTFEFAGLKLTATVAPPVVRLLSFTSLARIVIVETEVSSAVIVAGTTPSVECAAAAVPGAIAKLELSLAKDPLVAVRT